MSDSIQNTTGQTPPCLQQKIDKLQLEVLIGMYTIRNGMESDNKS